MTRISTFDLTPLYRNTVGFDRLFDRITNQIDSATSTQNYPPYDILRTGDNTYQICIAAAGFKQGEIDIEFHENQLVIKGTKNDTSPRPEIEYVHHGISNRAWVRSFALGDYIEVHGAKMVDGVLVVDLERVVPESMKPKKIQIAYEK